MKRKITIYILVLTLILAPVISPLSSAQAASSGTWKYTGGKWWYQYSDYSYACDGWADINVERYLFDNEGWMLTGWQQVDNNWYYLSSNGNMVTDTWVGDYYVNQDGIWDPSVQKDKWIYEYGRWWYRRADGTYTKNDWEYINGYWYLFDDEGWMLTGWQKIRNDWYYLCKTGQRVTNTWIDSCYLTEDGTWDRTAEKGQWIYNNGRWWYRHYDGTYTKNDWEQIKGTWYYFDKEGWMLTGWQKVNGTWYYLYSSGAMAANTWVGTSYFASDGSWKYWQTNNTTIDITKPMVALTYDDGPGPYTQAIVNCLESYDSRATFFVVGNRVNSYKDEIRAINNSGSEIANHSYTHATLTKLSVSGLQSEINQTDAAVKAITGKTPTLLRTPGGATNSTVKTYCYKPIIAWNIDTLDWKTKNKDKTISAVMNNVDDGDIVLMHDIHKATKDASLELIPMLIDEGYQLVTVSELAYCKGVILQNGAVYYNLP